MTPLVEERVSDVDGVLHVDKDALRRDFDVLVLEPLHELSQEADHGLGEDVDELDHLGELGLRRKESTILVIVCSSFT